MRSKVVHKSLVIIIVNNLEPRERENTVFLTIAEFYTSHWQFLKFGG